MIPDCTKRLRTAHAELAELLVSCSFVMLPTLCKLNSGVLKTFKLEKVGFKIIYDHLWSCLSIDPGVGNAGLG